MRHGLLKIYLTGKMLLDGIRDEHGQDLVEYAAVLSLVVLGITAGMSTLAAGINNAMTAVAGKVNTTIS